VLQFKYEYKYESGESNYLKKAHIIASSLAICLILIGVSIKPDQVEAKNVDPSGTDLRRVKITIPKLDDEPPVATPTVPKTDTGPAAELDAVAHWHKLKIKSGDNLSKLFKKSGFSAKSLHQIMQLGDATSVLKDIRPGQFIEFGKNADNKLTALKYAPSKIEQLIVINDHAADGQAHWHATWERKEIETRTAQTSATIHDSLFFSAANAGLSDKLIMQMAGIFGWDIDFALDIRKGDSFSVIYEERYLEGEKITDGEIIAAEFINQGKKHQAIRFTDSDNHTDYYSATGASMRKAFLRTPLKFSRISSRFTHKRWHPVLKKWRSHKGVDYAAPTGTPVKATSDGKIAFRGNKGGYGKVIFLKHGKTYTTVYGHLSKYAKNTSKGSKVKQGQIIGYVGSTGLATGPHLHYEMRVNGVHRNPLTVKLPKAKSINAKYKESFTQHANPLLAQLALIGSTKLASNQQASDTLTN
jgi:murein DD-endopeptidase MepM/ murein hydrolase activator NlpD